MKFLLSLFFLLISTVTFLYYLLAIETFLPFDSFGNYDWLNIGIFSLLSILSLVSLISIILYLIIKILRKGYDSRELSFLSLKLSFIVSLGILIVFILNFFSVLDWFWGGIILLVVLISLFII